MEGLSRTSANHVVCLRCGHCCRHLLLAATEAAARAWVEEHERPKHQWQKPTADTPMGTPCWYRTLGGNGQYIAGRFVGASGGANGWLLASPYRGGTIAFTADDVLLADPDNPETPPPVNWAGEEETK